MLFLLPTAKNLVYITDRGNFTGAEIILKCADNPNPSVGRSQTKIYVTYAVKPAYYTAKRKILRAEKLSDNP
jgi:hypothetical protein